MLPFIEQQNVYNLGEWGVMQSPIKTYVCPADPSIIGGIVTAADATGNVQPSYSCRL